MNDWMAYYRLEPWGPERADLNAGIIASTLANCHRDPKRRPEPFSPNDFMPKFGEPADREEAGGMTPEQIIAAFDGLIQIQERRRRSGRA